MKYIVFSSRILKWGLDVITRPCVVTWRCFCSLHCMISLLSLLSMTVLGTMIILIYSSFSTSNVERIFERSQDELLQSVTRYSSDWLDQGPKLLSEVLDLYLKFLEGEMSFDLDFPHNEMDAIEHVLRFFYSTRKSSDERITTIVYGGEIGNSFGVWFGDSAISFYVNESHRDPVCCNYTLSTVPDGMPSTGRLLYQDYTFSSFSFVIVENYDHRLMEWYLNSAATKDDNDTSVGWTNALTANNIIATTATKNLYDNDNNFKGVLGVMYSLDDFNVFLNGLNLYPGMIFMIDVEENLLLASSGNEALFTIDPVSGEYSRSSPEDCPDPNVQDATEYLLTVSGYLDSVYSSRSSFWTRSGEKWEICTERIDIEGGFKILIVYMIRESDLFSEIFRANRVTLWTSVCFIVFVFLLSSCCSCILLVPLSTLSQQMKKIEKMDLENIRIFYSPFREVRSLQRQFRLCVDMLEEYKSFLPKHVLTDLHVRSSAKRNYFSFSSLKSVMNKFGIRNKMMHKENNSSVGTSSGGGSVSCDSLDSNCSSSNNSSSGSNLSANTNIHLTNILFETKFGVGVHVRQIVCLYISLVNWSSLFSASQKLFLEEFSSLLEFVKKSCDDTNNGTLLSMAPHKIIYYYKPADISSAVKSAVAIEEAFCQSQKWRFKAVVAVTMSRSVHGIIGSEKSKMQVLCGEGGCVERAEYILKMYEKRMFLKQVERISVITEEEEEEDLSNYENFEVEYTSKAVVLMDAQVEREFQNLRKIAVPSFISTYDVKSRKRAEHILSRRRNATISSSNEEEEDEWTNSSSETSSNLLFVYRYFSEMSDLWTKKNVASSGEWMYQLSRENRIRSMREFRNAFQMLCGGGSLEDAKKTLLRSIQMREGGLDQITSSMESNEEVVVEIEQNRNSNSNGESYEGFQQEELLEIIESMMEEILQDEDDEEEDYDVWKVFQRVLRRKVRSGIGQYTGEGVIVL